MLPVLLCPVEFNSNPVRVMNNLQGERKKDSIDGGGRGEVVSESNVVHPLPFRPVEFNLSVTHLSDEFINVLNSLR